MKLTFVLLFFGVVASLRPDELYDQGLKLLSSKPLQGISSLEKAGYEFEHQQALSVLGNYFLFNSSSLRNSSLAFKLYSKLAALGNPIGHRMVGLLYATGIGVNRDYALAHLYIGLAVVGGDVLAFQVMGYWKNAGIATLKTCDDAVFYYQNVARGVVEQFYSSHPLGKNVPVDKKNIPEIEFGGVYGETVSGPGNPKVQKDTGGALSNRDIVEYYSLQADGGDKSAQILVAQVYYMGSHKIQVDYVKARRYALLAFKQNPIDESIKFTKKEMEKYSVSGTAADLLGKMYWRGEGVEMNELTAKRWFEKGAAVNNAACIYALGLMHEQGLGGLRKDSRKAFSYFKDAAALDNANALVKIALKPGLDLSNSFSNLLRASGKGNLIGTYHVAQHYFKGIGVTPNCVTGIGLLKHLIHTADWHQPFTKIGDELYEAGDYSGSLIAYIFAGEMGYQVAQTNAAWMLDQRKIPSADYSRVFTANTTEQQRYLLAYPLWNRAANLGNVDARVKMGDYYFREYLGQEFANSSQRYEKAAAYYQVAADHEFSAIAMWNLAYMYETGLGVNRDFNLAKRMYDLCLTTNPAGYIPVDLALFKLYIKWAWSWIKGDNVQSIFSSPPTLDNPRKSLQEDLYAIENEEYGLFDGNLLLLCLIGVATLMFYWRQRIGAHVPHNRHALPTDEEVEPIVNDHRSQT